MLELKKTYKAIIDNGYSGEELEELKVIRINKDSIRVLKDPERKTGFFRYEISIKHVKDNEYKVVGNGKTLRIVDEKEEKIFILSQEIKRKKRELEINEERKSKVEYEIKRYKEILDVHINDAAQLKSAISELENKIKTLEEETNE